MNTKWISILIILCLFIISCGDIEIQSTLRSLSAPATADTEITGVPIEVQELVWYDPEAGREKLRVILEAGDTQPAWVADGIRKNICKGEQQRRYYAKYIDADGIAIMGNSNVTDQEFHIARDIILTMTAKRPEMRKLMSPAGKFRVILVQDTPSSSIGEIPEFACLNYEIDAGGIGGRFKSVSLVSARSRSWHTQIHEFAHSIHTFINCYEIFEGYCYYTSGVDLDAQNFVARLKKAYETAIEAGTWRGEYAETSDGEYWAEGAVRWFLSIGPGAEFLTHADFAARDPLLAELLDEWFAIETFAGKY